MNWKRNSPLAASALGGVSSAVWAGWNLAAVKAMPNPGNGDYVLGVGGPLLLTGMAALVQLVIRWWTAGAAVPAAKEVETKVEGVIADEVARLIKAGKTDAARALLAATDSMQGRPAK